MMLVTMMGQRFTTVSYEKLEPADVVDQYTKIAMLRWNRRTIVCQ